MNDIAFYYEPAKNNADNTKYYVVWIDREGNRRAGATPWSKFVAACLCDSDHWRNPQSGLIREADLDNWFRGDDPMALTEDYKVRVKQRYITISNSVMEFNMRRDVDGIRVFRKGPPHVDPVFFESDSESTAVTKARAFIDEQLELATPPSSTKPPTSPVLRAASANGSMRPERSNHRTLAAAREP
jgi:hypothetical protein